MRPRRAAGVLCAALLATGVLAGCGPTSHELLPTCTSGTVVLTPEQTANAATIAAVGKRLGLPNHAVTVALATAFQESGMRNLTYGDRDSLGLFQQRPSQGWGTRQTVQTPRLAAASFYAHLLKVRGWASLPVTDAAQRVQHSAAPAAYAQWEDPARELARALTGEVAAGLTCWFRPAGAPGASTALGSVAVAELGPGGLTRTRTAATTWTTATWLVAHASSYGVSAVSVLGQSWTAKRGTWKADPTAAGLRWS